MTIGESVKRWRGFRGMSQSELETVSGVNKMHISAIERGARIPNLATIGKLARGLDIPAAVLVMDAMSPENVRDKHSHDALYKMKLACFDLMAAVKRTKVR